MTPAERDAIEAAAREAAKDAPPVSAEVLDMLRRDGFPAPRRIESGAA